ncbi:protein-tyrosine phosphatase-like protein [Mariannaea sp. PMI_226]|nr:protein-tyrosine phosphatase-like protein [Mariannaea sp. PMI_226]
MEADAIFQPSIANGATPSGPYSLRPPSPPFIHIPPHAKQLIGEPMPGLMPSYENVDSTQLTRRDLEIITQNASQIAVDRSADWSYGQRREAQQLLDFLYLGPNTVARDHAFLLKEGITMILVCRDARMAGTRLNSIEKAAQALNIQSHYLDIEGTPQMIRVFPSAIRAINDHLLAIYHSQAHAKTENGELIVESSSFRRGKVLIACETGNDRSAAIAAAYIMAMFNTSVITTLQFVSVQRFCCCFDEDIKRKLQSWEDILHAQSQVAAQNRTAQQLIQVPQRNVLHVKRHINEVMGADRDAVGDVSDAMADEDRFLGRGAYAPFVNQ